MKMNGGRGRRRRGKGARKGGGRRGTGGMMEKEGVMEGRRIHARPLAWMIALCMCLCLSLDVCLCQRVFLCACIVIYSKKGIPCEPAAPNERREKGRRRRRIFSRRPSKSEDETERTSD